MENLFHELEHTKYGFNNKGDEIENSIFEEFSSSLHEATPDVATPPTPSPLPQNENSREIEKKDLLKKMSDLRKELRKYKNTKNHRTVVANEANSKKRKLIHDEIERVNDRFEIIKIEEEGSRVSPAQILKETSKTNPFSII
jgi:hypothetical protein